MYGLRTKCEYRETEGLSVMYLSGKEGREQTETQIRIYNPFRYIKKNYKSFKNHYFSHSGTDAEVLLSI